MEEENKHIDELIANYLTEGLDKNALDELKTWIAASAENQQYFIRQREIWFSAVSREAASVSPRQSLCRVTPCVPNLLPTPFCRMSGR